MSKKQERLVQLLIENTSIGLLDWKQSVISDPYEVSFKDKGVRVYRARTRDGRPLIEVALINADGDVVDTFNDEDIGPAEWFDQMTELYTEAKKSALGTDKLLDGIIDELEPKF